MRECVERRCPTCGVKTLQKILKSLRSGEPVQWYRWGIINANGKSSKGLVSVDGTVASLIDERCHEMELQSVHLFNALWQHHQFTRLIEDIPERCVVMVLDFGQNYSTFFYQDEAQGAH